MSTLQEPPRWLVADDEIAAHFRPALRSAQNDGPSAASHHRMWSALAAKLPLAAFDGSQGAARAPAAQSGAPAASSVQVTATPVHAAATPVHAAATPVHATAAATSAQATAATSAQATAATSAQATATSVHAIAGLWRLIGTGVVAAAIGFGTAQITMRTSEPAQRADVPMPRTVERERATAGATFPAARRSAAASPTDVTRSPSAATNRPAQLSAAASPTDVTRSPSATHRDARLSAAASATGVTRSPSVTSQASPQVAAASAPELGETSGVPSRPQPQPNAAARSARGAVGSPASKRSARAPKPAATEAEPAATTAVQPGAPADLAAELDLLARARRVVAESPARALQLTAEHARRFQAGVLAQEREVLAIDALWRLGQRDLAAMRARRFAARYPNSAHRVRLDSALQAQ